ncbi:MAG: 2-phospho-L-lactate transferase [Chloroflexota bacterium]|nr:2-phospho-L-lactate transferase [Chloroflexota bacterium]
MRVVVLAGGYGGARMAHGFALLGDEAALTVIVNTADDLELHGLHVSPDLDTVMYTLAGLANPRTGWGVRDETWSAAAMLERYGEPTWFRLGDRDLATHIARTARLRAGVSLTDVTSQLAGALGIRARLLPMTDDRVRTKIRVADGWLDFQDYFVRRRHAEQVLDVRFDGIDGARPAPPVVEAIGEAELIVIAPSNPFVSVAPILALPGIADAIAASPAPVVAVSPIVAGSALRGPADAMLRTLATEEGAAGVARYYARTYHGLIDVLVVDRRDAALASGVAAAGLRPHVTDTLLAADGDRRRLAAALLAHGEPDAARTMRA